MTAPLPTYKTPENFRGNINGMPMYVMRDEPDVLHVMRDDDGAEYVCIGVRLFSDMQIESMRSMFGMDAKDNGPATARVHAALDAHHAGGHAMTGDGIAVAQVHADMLERWITMKRREELRDARSAEARAVTRAANIAAHRTALLREEDKEGAAWRAWGAVRGGRRSHKRRAHKLWRRRFIKAQRLYRAIERMGVHPHTGLPYVPLTDSDAPPLPPR